MMLAADGSEVFECIRCGVSIAIDELGYCGRCHWSVRAEVEDGLSELRQRLLRETEFQAWLREHPEAA